jgi:AcrR family transcriptional regulator
LLAAVGVERASIRAIAADAGVDPALIYHYFATKDQLITAALSPPVDPAELLAGIDEAPEEAGAELVRRVLTMWETDPAARELMVALLRAAISHDDAAAVLREVLGARILAPLQGLVLPEERALRTSLVASQIAGMLLARYVVGLPAVRDAAPEDLVRSVGPAIQHYLTGSLTGTEGPAPA